MKTILLQGIGEKPAKCASTIKAGDTILWNFGYTSKVLNVELKGKSAYITTLSESGNTYQRRFAQTRLLGIKE